MHCWTISFLIVPYVFFFHYLSCPSLCACQLTHFFLHCQTVVLSLPTLLTNFGFRHFSKSFFLRSCVCLKKWIICVTLTTGNCICTYQKLYKICCLYLLCSSKCGVGGPWTRKLELMLQKNCTVEKYAELGGLATSSINANMSLYHVINKYSSLCLYFRKLIQVYMWVWTIFLDLAKIM